MSHVTFANPAGEVCDDIKACIMLTGDTESKEGFAAMCERPDWKYGLNQVLTAVAVLDADPSNTLDDINSLFGCSDDPSTCVFEDVNIPVPNMYQQGKGLKLNQTLGLVKLWTVSSAIISAVFFELNVAK